MLDLAAERRVAAALPSRGIWIADPGPHDLPGIVERLRQAGLVDDAQAYAVRLDEGNAKPTHQASLLTQIGVQQARQGNITEAIRVFDEVLRLNPEAAVAHMELGTIFGRQNKLDKAVRHLREAVRLDGDRLPDAHVNLGVALRRLGQLDEAVVSLKRAIAIDRRLAPAHTTLALIYGQQGKMAEAADHFHTAIELEPQDVQHRVNFAVSLLKLQRPEDALTELQGAMQLDPDLPIAISYATEILGKLGRAPEAIALLTRAVERKPQVPQLRFMLARYHEQAGDFAEALREYSEAERLDRGNPAALTRLAWLRGTSPEERLRNGGEAVRLARRAVDKTKRQDVAALDALAAALAEAGDFPESISTAEEALRLAESQQLTAESRAIQHRLELYRAGKPFRIGQP
jgi:tetratricopeptide (TPR) repeat protein